MSIEDLTRRDRKSLRTRRQIVRAASELVLEDGYARATIARIAERADLATRTVTTRFASKEDIFFEGMDEIVDVFVGCLRTGKGDVIDRLQAAIAELSDGAKHQPEDSDIRVCRNRAIAVSPELGAIRVEVFNRVHEAVAEAVAADTGRRPDESGPQMIAAATVALFGVVERMAGEDEGSALPELERGLAVLRAALAAIH